MEDGKIKIFTISKEGVPLLDGEPIEGILEFSLEKENASSTALLTAKIVVRLNPKMSFYSARNDSRSDG